MQARRTLPIGQKVAKKYFERYSGQLICAFIRNDEQRSKRGSIADIIVKESGCSPLEKPEIVELRVEFHENDLQRRIKLAGSKWNSAKRVWEIHYNQALVSRSGS